MLDAIPLAAMAVENSVKALPATFASVAAPVEPHYGEPAVHGHSVDEQDPVGFPLGQEPSFFQMGKPMVTHSPSPPETPTVPAYNSDPSFFQLGKPLVKHGLIPQKASVDGGPDTSLGSLRQEEAALDSLLSRYEDSSKTSNTVPIHSEAVVAAISEVAGDPRKWGISQPSSTTFFASSGVFLMGAWYLFVWGGWRKYARKICCGRNKIFSSLPAAEEATVVPARTLEFRKPALSKTTASFAIPLIPIGDTIVEYMEFDITERERGAIFRAALTRLPGRDAWAKLEISMRSHTPGSPHTQMSPCLSCSRVEIADIESRNIQDAVDSWISLLMQDKCHDAPEVTGSEPDSQSESEQIAPSLEQPSANDATTQGVIEAPISHDPPADKGVDGKPGESKKKQPLRLEVRDGQGNNLGIIEPDTTSQTPRYVYQHSETKMEIDACLVEHTVVVSCNEKKQAIATGLKWDGSPELAGQEQADFLQVDTIIGLEEPDFMPVLLCVLAPVAFKR